jgi:hypothetical protein
LTLLGAIGLRTLRRGHRRRRTLEFKGEQHMTGTDHPAKRDIALTIITAVIAVAATLFAVAATAYIFTG